MMKEEMLIKLLKTSIVVGIFLILLGIYLHNFSEKMEELGVTGIIISAVCIATGFIFSLPTKIYLTILLMEREAEQIKVSNGTQANNNESDT
ncbi:MAG: hypothetical protein V7782_06160 [Psychromonas sp.]